MKSKNKIKALRHLIKHCWVHSGYQDCGYIQMDTKEKALYNKVIGRLHPPVLRDTITNCKSEHQ